jgi:hypothetical protein
VTPRTEAKTPPPRKRAAKKPTKVTTTTTVTPVDPSTVEHMIEEFAAQAEEISNQSRDFQETWVSTVANENIVFKRRNKVLVWLAASIAVLTLVLTVASGYQLYRARYQTGPLLANVQSAVTGIAMNQKGTDELVAFVHEIQAQTCDPTSRPDGTCPPSETEQLVGTLTSLLCSSSDPVRREACRTLGLKPVQAP